MIPEITDQSVALLLLRALAGVLFFAQAYDRIFKVGIRNTTEAFAIPIGQRAIKMQWAVGLSSYVELVAGALLILGLFRTAALYILAADMLLVAIVFSILRPMWDMQFYFPRLVLIAALLLLPAEWDMLSFDYFLK